MPSIDYPQLEWWTGRSCVGAALALAILGGTAGVALPISTQAAVIEFFNPDLNNYFITADPVEQDFVDTGAVGRWQRTGQAFAAGGPTQVCRFGGNGTINPATGTFFGPNSHFYTANAAECDGLKAIYTAGAKSWKFESNDFLTTPAINGGCPAGLVPVYRAYNNGFARGIDSNHRITSSRVAYLQTVAAGSIGEGVVMCAPGGPPPIATAAGVGAGGITTAMIGAAGGSVSSPDGKLTLIVPAGALAAPIVVGIQPITSLAPGGLGGAWRLAPFGQTFLQPVTLRYTYVDDDLAGTAAEFLGVAFQTPAGYWRWLGDATLDATAKTVSVNTSRFTDFSRVKGLQMLPPQKTVKTKGTVALQVKVCYQTEDPDNDLISLATDCNVNQGIVSTLSINEWSVNGVAGGGGSFGTVVGNGANATYTAPGIVPAPNPVAVSARVHNPKKGPDAKTLVSSIITIADESWTGTSTAVDQFFTLTVNVTWTLDSFVDNVATFIPTGTATISDVVTPACTARWNPSVHAFGGELDGNLTIDYNSTPPTYHGYGVILWPSTLSVVSGDCDGSDATIAGGAYLGGSSGVQGDASGTVSGDGKIIEGAASDTSAPPVNFRWKFTRD